MRRAARWWLVVLGLFAGAATHAQTGAAHRPDSLKASVPTVVADTARQVVVVASPEPPDIVTRRTGLRIGAAIVVITLTTLLLYNVRSR